MTKICKIKSKLDNCIAGLQGLRRYKKVILLHRISQNKMNEITKIRKIPI